MSDVVDGFQQQLSRYVVGIDLGTTNCAVAYVDTNESSGKIRCFRVSQWVDLGVDEARELLPSFHYQPLKEESASLGNQAAIVGVFARERGAQLPGRLIGSAKSWLCHAGVDRSSAILPWQSDSGVEKISPVVASSSYLKRIREAWDKQFPDHPLASQDLVITLPASFDQVARQLTIEAAKLAGLERIMPIEEPQAAFYAWLARHDDNWESKVKAGQTILVCDIGGGTTDFTLIRVREASGAKDTSAAPLENGQTSGAVTGKGTEAGQGTTANQVGKSPDQATINQLHQQRLTLHRVAVGQHLILGGDNIDLALARLSENKLTSGKALPPRSWDALLAACRTAKETLLGDNPPNSFTIHLPSSGSRLIGGGSQVEITGDEVRTAVIDGFFPQIELSHRPLQQATGFQEFGLPYASDPAVTGHLAAFLWDHRTAGRTDDELKSLDDIGAARPDWILFNGGVLTSTQIANRIVDCVASWFAGKGTIADDWKSGVLDGERLDLAVAYGAAYFARVKRGLGVEIEAKLACSYYLQVSNDPPEAVCLVPGSASPGDQYTLEQPLQLIVGQPVQFPILYSSTRLADAVGTRVSIVAEAFSYLPPIRTVLDVVGKKRKELLPVQLHVELSQIGTLQMWCQSLETPTTADSTAVRPSGRWKLEFDIRGSTQTDHQLREATANQAGILDDGTEQLVREIFQRTFASSDNPIKTSKVLSELTQALGMGRSEWPPQLLRTMWQTLIDLREGRKKSPEHEARWLNLLGYTLRPGYGMAADDWRVAESWRHVHGKLNYATPSSRNEAFILWRRIAGGFTAGQQLTVYQQIAGPLRQVLDPSKRGKGAAANPQELIELLRLAGSLELLSKLDKTQLGTWCLDLLSSSKYRACHGALCWCLARLAARQPSYGPLNCVIDTADTERWVERLLNLELDDSNYDLVLMQSSRKVGDRYRDISDTLRTQVLRKLELRGASAHYQQLVREGGALAGEEASEILGDSLPLGLQLRT